MRHRISVVFVAIALFSSSGAPSALAQDHVGENGALQYWHAFLLAPNPENLTEEEAKVLKTWPSASMNAETKAILAKYQSAMAYVRRGSSIPQCDFGFAAVWRELGPLGIDSIHLYTAGYIVRACCLQAKSYFNEKDAKAGLTLLHDVLVMLRRLGETHGIVGKVWEYRMEHEIIEFLATAHSEGDSAEIWRNFLVRWEKLPASRTLSDVLKTEEKAGYIGWIKSKGLKAVETLRTDLEKEVPGQALGLKEENMPALAEAIAKRFDEVAAIAALPPAKCAQKEKEIEDRYPKDLGAAEIPLLVVFPHVIASNFGKIRYLESTVQAKRVLLRAGILAALEGEKAVEKIPDPSGTGTVQYRKLEKGFEISCGVKDEDGQRISLVFSELPHEELTPSPVRLPDPPDTSPMNRIPVYISIILFCAAICAALAVTFRVLAKRNRRTSISENG
jgi:hypothetical protein